MKPPPFDYLAPTTVAEVTSALAEHGDDAKVLAGGQSLVPVLAMRLARPEVIVDVNRVADLDRVHREDGTLLVGATTRHVTLERDPDIAAAVPLLARTAPHIGHFQIRNRGTLGGSLAHADSAAEWPAVALALDAEIEVASTSGSRRIPAAEFFVSTFMTALGAEDLLVGVRFPVWGAGSGFAVEELARRSGDFAIAGVVAAVQRNGDRIERAAVALLGMGPVPIRLHPLEQELVGSPTASTDLDAVARDAVAGLDPPDDVHASGGYRRRVAAVLVARALARALQEAEGA
ncbi:MAG TPA: xanthine dehydrogenase family protein subunit M [Mycobacteriales bacterium]|nr:xanthine dehydrogenase family protein subunit M [Mycobacteriales bacterium]